MTPGEGGTWWWSSSNPSLTDPTSQLWEQSP
jgi:hypothetical protein